MDYPYIKILETFNINSLPDLDIVVLGALELFIRDGLSQFDSGSYNRPIVIGSGNAKATGAILYTGTQALFADESEYEKILEANNDIDGAILISASGAKHSVGIAENLKSRGIETKLITNNPKAPAAEEIKEGNIFVFPKNREPYTYNTSTYMGMILSKTEEDPKKIKDFIESVVAESIPKNLAEYEAFFILVPIGLQEIKPMILTKFDELFGPRVSARVYTTLEAKHAKTVVSSPNELLITFGDTEEEFDSEMKKINIPLPENIGYGAIMAISYYFIGQIQKQHPPYFKENIKEYTKEASHLFGNNITPIVE